MNRMIFILCLLAVTGCFQKNDKTKIFMKCKEEINATKIEKQKICCDDRLKKQKEDNPINTIYTRVRSASGGGGNAGGGFEGKIFYHPEDSILH